MPISFKLTHPILFVLLVGHIHVHAQSVAESRRIIETLDAASGKPVSGAPVTLSQMTDAGEASMGTISDSPQTASVAPTTPVAQTPMDPPGNVSPASGFGGPAGGNPPGDWKSYLKTFLSALAFLFMPLLAYFGLREVVVRTTVFFMMRSGKRAEPTQSAPPASILLTPPAPLEFLEINTLNGVLLNGSAQDRLERAQFTNRRKLNILLLSFVAQIIGLLAAVALITWRFPQMLAVIAAGIGALLVIDLLTVFYSWTLYLQGVLMVEVAAIFASALIAAAAATAVYFKVPFYLALIPAIAQVATLLVGLRRIRQAALGDGNRKVVILRVFGSDKNAAFTFGNLMSQWRFIGSFLTIADPAYIRYRFSIFNRSNARKSVGATLTFSTVIGLLGLLSAFLPQFAPGLMPESWASLSPEDQQSRIKGVASLVLAILAILPTMYYMRRRFLKSPDQAIARVQRVQHAKLGFEADYHGSALFCFDDVWKPAVGKMLEVADVVLMDLRGFSEKRQGCAYEIGELMEHFPVDRLLFLVDKKTPKDLLYKLIKERWSKIPFDSPNRKSQPVVKVYETSDRDKRDIPRIAALLSASLDGHVYTEQRQLAHWA